MSSFSKYEKPFRITGVDGTVIFEGAQFVSDVKEVFNGDSATIGRGEAVRFDVDSVLARWDYAAADVDFAGVPTPGATTVKALPRLKGLRVSLAANVAWIGVALEDIPVGQTGEVCGLGSIVMVKCINPPTSNVVGSPVIGSSTAGSVNATAPNVVDSAAAVPPGGTILGRVFQIAGTADNTTGSVTQLLVGVGHS